MWNILIECVSIVLYRPYHSYMLQNLRHEFAYVLVLGWWYDVDNLNQVEEFWALLNGSVFKIFNQQCTSMAEFSVSLNLCVALNPWPACFVSLTGMMTTQSSFSGFVCVLLQPVFTVCTNLITHLQCEDLNQYAGDFPVYQLILDLYRAGIQ